MIHTKKVTAASDSLPVTLEEAKSHLRLTHDKLDADVELKLRAAIDYIETKCEVALRCLRVVEDWDFERTTYAPSHLVLYKQPTSVHSVVTYDDNGTPSPRTFNEFRVSGHRFYWDSTPSDVLRMSLDYTANSPCHNDMSRLAILMRLTIIWGDLTENQHNSALESARIYESMIDRMVYR